MLTQLSISNYVLIEELQLNLKNGLTVVTGETGAGKSILLGALQLVLGERADLQSLNFKEQKCVIEAHFDLSKLNLKVFFEEESLDFDSHTILRRELLPTGKSRAFVNDVPVTLNILQALSSQLIDIHSQFESSELLLPEFQFNWIDNAAKNNAILDKYQIDFKNLKNIEKEINILENQYVESIKEKDYNQFLFGELQGANLDSVDLEVIETEVKKLENVELILENLSASIQIFENQEYGILNQMSEFAQKFRKIEGFLSAKNNLNERIHSITIELNDVFSELNDLISNTENNPNQLLESQEKLNFLHQLLLKHRANSIADLIEIRNNLNEKLQSEANLNEEIESKKKLKSILIKKLSELSNQLNINRLNITPKLEKEIISTLNPLGMENSRIKIELSETEELNVFGKNKIRILFSANPGSSLTSIEKSVSGGERSRLMLAIKKSMAQSQNLPTLILDEIDTGVSGKVANEMGKIMQEMSKDLQLISITHLPQIASKGENHLKVTKKITGKTTQTFVNELNTEERVEEIAHLISGEKLSNAALNQAKELLDIS